MIGRKKIIYAILVFCMLFAMLVQVGCGGKIPEESATESTPESTSDATSESTPEATPESTPDATPESTPDATSESTPESTPETSVPEETPDLSIEYNITYDLDGGSAANGTPDRYTALDGDITLYAPVKTGYAFAGWTGTGLSQPTVSVTIPSGSSGDRSYTATWKEVKNLYSDVKPGHDPLTDVEIESYRDSHDTLAANPEELPVSSADLIGKNGEGIFLAKTAYTAIDIDGVKDNVYTYGIHLVRDMVQYPNLYKDSNTGYDVYIVCGQDGKVRVFAEVTDSDIVINDEMWGFRWWHCDSFEMYIDFENDKNTNDYRWTFAADDSKKYTQKSPENWTVVMTDKGFNVEFEFDNNGKPFEFGDKFGFGFFYNDTMNYVNTEKYDRSNSGTTSVLSPEYHLNDPAIQDAVMITSYPVDYDGELLPERPPVLETGDMFKDIASGALKVGVITSKYTTAYNEINAEELVDALCNMCIDASLVREDKLAPDDVFDFYIYMNTAEDGFANDVFSTMKYNQYGVALYGNKMAAFGWTWDANDEVCNVILSIFGSIVSSEDDATGKSYVYTHESVRGDNVPMVEGTYCVVDSGEDSYVVVKYDTTLEYFNEYAELLKASGYKLYQDNLSATVSSATYYTEDTVVSLVYSSAEGDRAMRVIVDPMGETALPPLEVEEYEKVAVSSVTQLPLWLCHIIKLDNGEYIIIDGGMQDKRHGDKLYNELAKLEPGDGPIVIAAWIFTHFHQDHVGAFLDLIEVEKYMERVTIKSVIYDPPERFFIDASISHSLGDRANAVRWRGYIEKLKEGGTTVYQARTGQIYRFGNAEIEILGTFDDIVPFYKRKDESNHTCVHFSIRIAGKKLMYVGDATSPQLLLTAKRYGDYLKSDFVQISHHGFGDGGSDPSFYQCVDAPVVFHPGTALSGGAEKWAVENAEEYYNTVDSKVTVIILEEE